MKTTLSGNGERHQSNARLIAAAPELLEALRGLTKRMRDSYADHGLDWTELDSDAYEQAFKAIEKAEGEQ